MEPDSFAVTRAVAPWSECTIQPEHGPNDQAHTARVSVGRDGELRFFPPRSDWGSRLQLDCKLGDVRTPYVVDLNDPSTHGRKSSAELQPRRVGVQPALEGDIAAIPLNELLKRGYPPRPDPVTAPKQFAEWAEHVTKPLDLLEPVPVANLAARAGTYDGLAPPGGVWDGFVQSGGFLDNGAADSSLFYMTYTAIITVPSAVRCSHFYCGIVLWAGIGGFPSDFFGQYPSGTLFQSGIHIQTTNNPTPITSLFIEYAPNGIMDLTLPSGDQFDVGDQIRVWGWSSADSSCQNAAPSSSFACFSFIDYNKDWAYVPQPLPGPSDGLYLPTTANWVVEMPDGLANNIQYSGATISSAFAFDTNGNNHGDPTGPDPYEWSTTGRSTAQFANGTQDTPADPMQFIWNTF